jgi:hypothetical protein
VKEIDDKYKMSIFPNPVTSILHFKNLVSASKTFLTIENLFGQTVLEMDLKSNEIDVTDLLPALYIIKIRNEQGIGISRFLKE